MRPFFPIIIFALITLGCSAPSNQKEEAKDTRKVNLEKKSTPTNIGDILSFPANYPLDSLLSFDSEAALKKVFGQHVKRSVGYYPEGMGEYANTLLFPDSKNQVEFVWSDDTLNMAELTAIKLYGNRTDWQTRENITLGMGISELEKLNKTTFTFAGMEWDYAGVIDWQGGQLSKRQIYGSMGYHEDKMPENMEGIIGDQMIESSSDIAKNSHLVLAELVMRPE